jgi:transcriptional regulator with XRE-family HTH domain
VEREDEVNMELRATREASGKTQAQVAKEAGVTERMYQYYEANEMEPGVRTAIRIASALDSTVEDLFKTDVQTQE